MTTDAFVPGETGFTLVAPGLEALVEVVAVVERRGSLHYVVETRVEPDVVLQCRPAGTIYRQSRQSGPWAPVVIARG